MNKKVDKKVKWIYEQLKKTVQRKVQSKEWMLSVVQAEENRVRKEEEEDVEEYNMQLKPLVTIKVE